MINTCAQCGSYRRDKEIRQNPSRAICPDCGHSHPFLQLPLFIVCGTSGGGKTAVPLRKARFAELTVDFYRPVVIILAIGKMI